MTAREVGLAESPQLVDQPRPCWCAVANVAESRPSGPGGLEIRHGTKHFAPGSKVYLVTGYWGMGGMNVTVLGRHRGTHRFIKIDIRSDYLRNWRTELAYSPTVTKSLEEHGEYTCRGKQASDSEEAKQHANKLVTRFSYFRSVNDAGYSPMPGPLPDEAKALALRHGPVGVWSSLSADGDEQPGPSEIRFFNDDTGFFLPHAFEASSRNPIRFRWFLAAPGRIRIHALAPDENIPASRDNLWTGPAWDEVAYEFRLVVKPTAAFEALAEINRDGFWISPLPLVWAGRPFCTAP